MPGSRRTTPLPANWPTIRKGILQRDGYVCQLAYPTTCTTRATQVDHIIPAVTGTDDHRPTNLQAACAPCHARKTGREAQAARPTRRRQSESHPGAI